MPYLSNTADYHIQCLFIERRVHHISAWSHKHLSYNPLETLSFSTVSLRLADSVRASHRCCSVCLIIRFVKVVSAADLVCFTTLK